MTASENEKLLLLLSITGIPLIEFATTLQS